MDSTDRLMVLRILDANMNRAREALRVLEEHCRFVLDDTSLCEETKAIRHEVSRLLGDGGSTYEDGLVARDIVGDVGKEVESGQEYVRENASSVAVAAARRASEAIRAIEEYGKVLSQEHATVGRQAESLRYRLYELERRVGLVRRANRTFGHVRLYVIITDSHCRGSWQEAAAAAIRGGATCLQLREKDLSDQELLERASEFVAICRAGGAISVINDRCDVAMASGADGVHVGQDDIAVTTVRRLVGPDMVIGVSTHNLEQARAAAQSGVDYVAIGPMYATSTKPRSFVAGIETLSNVRKNMSLPLVAIGGIDAARAGDVMQAGADCLCVCTAVTAHDDPESQARAFSQHFAGANAGA